MAKRKMNEEELLEGIGEVEIDPDEIEMAEQDFEEDVPTCLASDEVVEFDPDRDEGIELIEDDEEEEEEK